MVSNQMNEYPNIFESSKWIERISEYIHIIKFQLNEYPNTFVKLKNRGQILKIVEI